MSGVRKLSMQLLAVAALLSLHCSAKPSEPQMKAPLQLARTIAEEVQAVRDNPQLAHRLGSPSMADKAKHTIAQEDWDRFTVKGAAPPKINVTNLGVVMTGFTMNTIENRTIYAFQGIRYGKADRFKYSEDPGNYWGTAKEIKTDHLGDKCAQRSYIGNFASGSEDCLFLNVYIPMMPKSDTKLPVMLFIHGGSFTSGDASLYLPTRLLDKDVILVVIQYRLGALGWLSMQNDDAPGNAGLSDQILSLKWVQKNIKSFGGDPGAVTIFGQSAGSVSVSMLQTIGKPTEGLFARALSESGSSLEYWAIDVDPENSAYLFGNTYCNCNAGDNMTALYQCLKKKSSDEMAMCTSKMVSSRRQEGYMGFEGCAPVVQSPDVKNPLITKKPEEYIQNKEAHDIPLMMGANRDEGSFVFGVMYVDYLEPNNLTNNGDYLSNRAIVDIMNAFGVEDQTHSLADALQRVYLPGIDMTNFDDLSPGMIDMVGVLFLKGGTYERAKEHSRLYNASTYFYSFEFVSNDSLLNWMFVGDGEMPFDGGVTHGDELMYIFSLPSSLTDKQLLTKDRLVTLWTNFATYGNPTPDNDKLCSSLGIPTWPNLKEDSAHFLLISDNVTVGTYYPDRWTIEGDLHSNSTIDPSSTTPIPIDPADYDKLQQESTSYMIAMIVFIVAFVAVGGIAGFLFYKMEYM